MKEIGKAIRKRRKLKGIQTQSELSKRCGVSRQRISDMERGQFHGRITDLILVLDAINLTLKTEITKNPVFEDLKELFPDD